MDGQSEPIDTRRTSQGKNAMMRETSELMKLTKNTNTRISTLRGEGSENAEDKEDR